VELSEALAYVFFDSLMSALVLPIQTEVATVAIRVFGGYPFSVVGVCAVIGSVIACLANMFVGRYLLLAFKIDPTKPKKNGWYASFVDFFHKIGQWFLVLSSLPILGGFLVFVAGMAALDYRRVLVFALLSNSIFYTVFFLVPG